MTSLNTIRQVFDAEPRTASREEVATTRLACDRLLKEIKGIRDRCDMRLRSESKSTEGGTFRAGGRTWYMTTPGQHRSFPVEKTLATFRAGGVSDDLIMPALEFKVKAVDALAAVHGLAKELAEVATTTEARASLRHCT